MKITVTKSINEVHKNKEILDDFIKARVDRLKKKGFKNIVVKPEGDSHTINYEAKQ